MEAPFMHERWRKKNLELKFYKTSYGNLYNQYLFITLWLEILLGDFSSIFKPRNISQQHFLPKVWFMDITPLKVCLEIEAEKQTIFMGWVAI